MAKKTTAAAKRKAAAEQSDPEPEISAKSQKKGKLTSVAAKKTVRHKVRKGETLTSIASDYNTTVAQLKKDNRLSASNVKAGQVLVIK